MVYSHHPYDPGTLGMGGSLSSPEMMPSGNNNLETGATFTRSEPMLDEEFISKLPDKQQQEITDEINRRTEFRVLKTTYKMY